MNSAFLFDGKSRVNRLNLARDHHSSRSTVLLEAQQRRAKREEDTKRNAAAAKLHRVMRLFLAKLHFVTLAVKRVEEVISGNNTNTINVPSLEQVCWSCHYIKEQETYIPTTLLENTDHGKSVKERRHAFMQQLRFDLLKFVLNKMETDDHMKQQILSSGKIMFYVCDTLMSAVCGDALSQPNGSSTIEDNNSDNSAYEKEEREHQNRLAHLVDLFVENTNHNNNDSNAMIAMRLWCLSIKYNNKNNESSNFLFHIAEKLISSFHANAFVLDYLQSESNNGEKIKAAFHDVCVQALFSPEPVCPEGAEENTYLQPTMDLNAVLFSTFENTNSNSIDDWSGLLTAVMKTVSIHLTDANNNNKGKLKNDRRLAALSRLTRLLPFFVEYTTPNTVKRDPQVLLLWLSTVADLAERVAGEDAFLHRLLSDLRGGGRYRYLVSYLYSTEGGLRLLDHLVQQKRESNVALEMMCGVLAWPLFRFSTQSQDDRETRAILLKLAFKPNLLAQLWGLYRERCEGIHSVTPEEWQRLSVECTATDTAVRLPRWCQTPQELLSTELKLKRHLFYDPNPALSVLFFTLLHTFIGATDFTEAIRKQTLFGEGADGRVECLALVLALKEIAHRAHLHGVVPGTNSEAVAHMAFLLLARLHVVNEATQFLPLPSAWVSVRDTLLLRNLDSISVERWTELEEEHLHSGHDAMEDEEEEKKAPQVKPLPGDDTLFTNSCHWSTEERLIRLLLRIAFLVSFNERAKLLTRFLLLSQPQRHPGMPKQFVVHRGRTFVDTYERFKHQPDSVEMFSVRFAGANGEYEEGYGQGVYRELLHCIGLEGFTAEHGLFRTTEDGFVYPNPLSFETTGDEEHLGKISFLGFMCGRSLRDGILQDVPFALHFRNALLGRRNTINNLKGFDAQLYRQLVSLVNLTEEELSLMELTFTYVDNSLGVAREYELVRGGAEMKVNTHNRLFYIDLVADYKLNREGAPQTLAFQAGLERIIHRSWLRLFDSIELFKLFGGDNSGSFDVADWKKHTVYKDPEDEHSVPVKLFWEVVESMTAEQQSALLRFATSMRRPPLLGFQFLSPPFMVYLVKNISSQRLPTASTCFSTFKLPPYTDYGTAREKILAAIEEGTTFELT